MRVPVTTSKKIEIANRRKQVAQLYLNHVQQCDIAEKLGYTQATISGDLKALNKQWVEESQADISKIKARELAELDFMELEASAQYQAAKKAGKEVSALRYAAHRLDIKDRRAKFIGLDKPQKVEVDTKQQLVINLVRKSCRKEDNV